MKNSLIAVLAAAVLLVGCGKKEEGTIEHPPSGQSSIAQNAKEAARDQTTSDNLYAISHQRELTYISFYNTSDVMLVKTNVGGTTCVVGKVYGDPATSLSCDWGR